jgi:tRNA 5-methylaminomethyl-2-thiouridine biosynthesis bifunctional protein
LQHDNGVWRVLDAQGLVLCSAERVVFSNACGARALLQTCAQQQPELAKILQRLPATQGIRGLLSWADHTGSRNAALPEYPEFPAFPVNGAGSLISHVPLDAGTAWFAGSSYQPAHQPERSDTDNHAHNLGHLQQLAPDLAAALTRVFAIETLQSWKGIRCVSADRMPLVGPLDGGPTPSLWLCAALGSRGLSFSVLCAELLAARMGAEPLPVEANLAKVLDALRA